MFVAVNKNHCRSIIALLGVSVLFSLTTVVNSQTLPRPTGMAPKPTPTPKALTPLIWRDPGAVETLDLAGGPGGRDGAPAPPFTFVEENLKGTNPKVKVKDAKGVEWSAKWGTEVNAENLAIRLLWAVGYFVEPAYFVPAGKIEGVTGLTRAKSRIKEDGSFAEARFERQKEKGVKELQDELSWSWIENPFVGTKELNGLKVMLMLVSNWDNKDVRDVSRGSNTAIHQTKDEARYLVTDWGGSFGKWGNFISREKWDCRGFQGQTRSLVKGVRNGIVEFGYSGQHSKDFSNNIKVEDVQWLVQFLDKLTEEQLKAALEASGATPEDQVCFAKAILERIDKLKQVK